ncbi:MAG: saccharopine dehydrogenase NADP-binding domain-containing protein [Phycisphaerales bacterium]|nr:saccharopine dehydrogenase NADP-binding domain-containing protein [Phycisphaerales bacterium]
MTPSQLAHTLVLGGGLVGRVIAEDLTADPDRRVTLADRDPAVGRQMASIERLDVVQLDCTDTVALESLIDGHELVVGALPSQFGFEAMAAVVRVGRPMCDISFMAQDARAHHAQAVSADVPVVFDCGVAPGMSHLLAGAAARMLSPCRSISIRVGGIPVLKDGDWNYAAPFSPGDVIEEYLRPARLVRDGVEVIEPALSGCAQLHLPHVGTVEAFNTDGLRSLTSTLEVPDMVEQTIRWPGTCRRLQALRDAGAFDDTPIVVDGVQTTRRAITCGELFDAWRYRPGDRDCTVMRVEAHGDIDGVASRLRWDLYDEYDPVTGWSSMARTTALPATLVARALESGRISTPGVHAPETLGSDPNVVRWLLASLEARGVRYEFTSQAC